MEILHKISWIPYKLVSRFRSNKKNPLFLDFRKVGIPKLFKFYVLKNDIGLSNQLRSFGFREPLNLKYLYDFIEKNDAVLDIGANIGLFPLLSCNAKKIVAVEPIKECIPILKRNLKENKLLKKSKIINMAVGEEGKLMMKKDDKINLSKVVKKKEKDVIEIRSKPLNYFTKKYKSNVIRIDVEGYEYEILYKKIPKSISKISMEIHPIFLGEKRVSELMNYFEKEGFKVKYFLEDLPIRLYPFYSFFKKLKILGLFVYAKKDLKPSKIQGNIKKGRAVKYLFLKR